MSNQTLSTKIFLRNDTESNWSSQNPVLGKGEVGIAIDKQYFKIGDGTNNWSAIKDLYPITKIDTELNIKNSSNAVFGQIALSSDTGILAYGKKNGTFEIVAKNADLQALSDRVNIIASSALTESKSYTDASVSTLKGSASDAATSVTVYGVKNYAKSYADSILSANDAMVFKGTIGTGGTITVLPTSGYSAGWTYKVITAGTYAGQKCEIGDMIVAVKDFVTTTANSDWTVIQTNIDGAVIGPTSSTSGNVALFDDSIGKVIKNSSIVGVNILQSTDLFIFDCGNASGNS